MVKVTIIMQLSEQRSASKKIFSYIVAEKLGKQILSGYYEPESLLPGEIELSLNYFQSVELLFVKQ